MLKIGLEKEFFVVDAESGDYIIVPNGLPHDDCGWLAEARGKPNTDIVEAIHSLYADCYRLHETAKDLGCRLVGINVVKLSRKLQLQAQRKYAKGKIHYENLYGYEHHRNSASECLAGVHVSFTNECTIFYGDDNKSRSYNGIFDYAKLFRRLDDIYAEEIKDAKRRPGFYEIKPDGRIEYRSLPTSINLMNLITNLQTVVKGVL